MGQKEAWHVDGLVQVSGISIANELEILQSCIQQSIQSLKFIVIWHYLYIQNYSLLVFINNIWAINCWLPQVTYQVPNKLKIQNQFYQYIDSLISLYNTEDSKATLLGTVLYRVEIDTDWIKSCSFLYIAITTAHWHCMVLSIMTIIKWLQTFHHNKFQNPYWLILSRTLISAFKIYISHLGYILDNFGHSNQGAIRWLTVHMMICNQFRIAVNFKDFLSGLFVLAFQLLFQVEGLIST